MDDAPELTCEGCGATIPLKTGERGWAVLQGAREFLTEHAGCQVTVRLEDAG